MELDKKRFSIRWHITLVLTLLTVLIVLLIGVCVAVVGTKPHPADQRGGFLFKPADPHAGKPACHPGILYHQPGAEQ